MNTKTSLLSFDAYRISIEAIAALRAPLERIRTHDGPLATQIRKAASSVALNVAEGRRRRGRDKLHFWHIAAGSAEEVIACLHVAIAWGYFESESQLDELLELLDRELAMLWRLTH